MHDSDVAESFRRYLYYILLFGCVILLILSAVFDYYNLFFLFPPDGNFLSILWKSLTICSQLLCILVMLHFVLDKKPIISILILIGLLVQVWKNAILSNYSISYEIDNSKLFLLERLGFWIYIALALAHIYYDKKRYSWLLYIGANIALFEIVRYMNVNNTPLLSVLQFILQLLGDIIFILYIWNYMKRNNLWERRSFKHQE